MKKIIFVVFIASSLTTFISYALIKKALKILYFYPNKVPKSDVPIITKIGWWHNPKSIVIEELTAKANPERLGLGKAKFIVRYKISGKVANISNWKPILTAAQITHRISFQGNHKNSSTISISIVPIFESKEDSNYLGQEIMFNANLEEEIPTISWGKNIYEVSCEKIRTNFIVFQAK